MYVTKVLRRVRSRQAVRSALPAAARATGAAGLSYKARQAHWHAVLDRPTDNVGERAG
jgi:hypothetical protein